MPRAKTTPKLSDHLGTFRVRVGIARTTYKVNPGLYCVGTPSEDSPVLVTANYKLSFDTLRFNLQGEDLWILVVDTRGINVWCAAGKGTFSADEIARQVKQANLDRIVTHRKLILPQLAAVGVASHELKRKCGFKAVYGPIRAQDLSEYMKRNNQADESMRSVTFSLGERLILTPVELVLTWKVVLSITLISLVSSGVVPGGYSLEALWGRGLFAIGATMAALLAGALVTPVLLPLIPGRQFWFKGALVGFLMGLAYQFLFLAEAHFPERLGILLWVTTASSYLAMNFTGATPYTSLSGVEQEMRKGLPFQMIGAGLSVVFWIAAPFLQ
ncbi:MAG: hypothetical protein HKP52_06470 [Desulfofustis sp.]|nr:hypothetical protein [Desulfofustis sp.]